MSLSKNASSSGKTEHWTIRASRVLRTFETYLKEKDLVEDYQKFTDGKSLPSIPPSGSGQSSGGGGDDDTNPDRPPFDEGDGGDSSDDSEGGDDSDFSSSDGKILTVFVSQDIINTKKKSGRQGSTSFKCEASWKFGMLRCLVFDRWGIPKSDQVYFLNQASTQFINPNLTFAQNGVGDGATVFLKLSGLMGGGKRANTSSGKNVSNSNVTANAKSKDEALNILEDTLGSSSLRFQANPNAGPVITIIAGKVTQLLHAVKTQNIDLDNILNGLSIPDLEKLLKITVVSTKVPDRCRFMSDLCFASDVRSLKELVHQHGLAYEAMPLSIQYALTDFLADEGGNISWSKFIDAVDFVKTQKEKARVAPANGLGDDAL